MMPEFRPDLPGSELDENIWPDTEGDPRQLGMEFDDPGSPWNAIGMLGMLPHVFKLHEARTVDRSHGLNYIHAMNDEPYHRPSMRAVLGILGEAGAEGILSTDVARHFTTRDRQTTISWTNSVLSRAKYQGYAQRSGHRQMAPGKDRRSAAFRWRLSPRGAEYLNPPPLPRIEPSGEPPSPRRVLELLTEAGEEGMRGPDIARHFTVPEPHMPSMKLTPRSQSLQRLLAWTNQILDRFARSGYVRRGEKEPSPYYHRVPAYRWFVTPEGAGYLAAGLSDGIRAARRSEREHEAATLAAHRRHLADLLTDAYDKHDPGNVPYCERERVMRELRGQGCTLHDIGEVFGITRERVRQVLDGYRVHPCTCARCTGARWPEVTAGAG